MAELYDTDALRMMGEACMEVGPVEEGREMLAAAAEIERLHFIIDLAGALLCQRASHQHIMDVLAGHSKSREARSDAD